MEVFVIAIVLSVTSSLITGLIVAKYHKRRVTNWRSLNEEIPKLRKERDGLLIETDKSKETLERYRAELEQVKERTQELVQLEARSHEIVDLLENGRGRYDAIMSEIEKKVQERETIEQELHELKSEIDLYSRVADFVDYGIFEEPEYLYETSERYVAEIKRIRDQQRQAISDKTCIELPDDIQVDGSSKTGSAVLAGQAKMMLRTFNIECDLLISKLKPSNFDRTLERIEKIAEDLEKLSISLMAGISPDYVKLKFEEAKLQYEFTLKKEQEKEEQRLIREQIREEQKAEKEYERAIAEAEKEQKTYEDLLKKARKELNDAQESMKAELNAQISLLEAQLKEAQEKGTRAQSLAEQTRRGHVYVISNIGSFGENVFKIGLTRRLDPLDRIKELGDASVPFQFDVHATIFSDDAPSLENALHKHFHNHRVNAVNFRKEFFSVDLKEIKNAVEELGGCETSFKMTALAEEYYESLRLQGRSIEMAS